MIAATGWNVSNLSVAATGALDETAEMKKYLLGKYMVATFAGAVALSSSILGCGGGSGGGGSCGKVNPCGGNIVGNWKVTQTCYLEGEPPDFCPTATVDLNSSTKVSGDVAFKADMTFNAQLTASITVIATYPNSCLTMNGVTLTCAQFEAAQKAALAMDPDSGVASLTCASSGSSCKCTGVGAMQSTTGMGTFATAGTKLTSTEAGMPPDETDYCVQGNTLHIVELSMAMGMMGKISSDLVLTKQ